MEKVGLGGLLVVAIGVFDVVDVRGTDLLLVVCGGRGVGGLGWGRRRARGDEGGADNVDDVAGCCWWLSL